MAEYIEREALIAEINMQRKTSKTSFPKQSFVVGDVLTCIYTAPSADVAHVVHGRWIEHEFEDEPCYGTEYECSVCHKYDYDNPKYCPNCGADMRGVNDE